MEWEVHEKYLADKAGDIQAGKPVELKVMDREKFVKSVIRGVVSKSKAAGADPLWIVHETELGEMFLPEPLWIRLTP